MPCESLVGSPGSWRRQQEAGNGLLNLIGRAVVVGGGTTAFPCVCTSEQRKDVHIVLPLGCIFHGFNTWDKPRPFPVSLGSHHPRVISGSTLLAHSNSTCKDQNLGLLEARVWAKNKGQGYEIFPWPWGCPGIHLEGRSALPWIELLQWCYSLSKRIMSFGCSHLLLAYT